MSEPVSAKESILASTKKLLGIEDGYTDFDVDVMLHINTTFTTLVQLGIGPVNGFMITGRDERWGDFLGEDLNLNSVKSYIALKVRLMFDPPATSFHINAINEQLRELEYRLNVHREATQWAEPIGPGPHDSDIFTGDTFYDGGTGY